MKARAVRVSASAAISASVAVFSNSWKLKSKRPQEMVRRVAEDRVLPHSRGRQRERRAVADAAKRGDGAAAFAFCEAPPELGPRPVGRHVVHVDAVLAEERQDVLACLDQPCRAAVLKRAPQRAEPLAVLGRLGEVQRHDVVGDRQGLREAVRRRSKRKARLGLAGCGRASRGP